MDRKPSIHQNDLKAAIEKAASIERERLDTLTAGELASVSGGVASTTPTVPTGTMGYIDPTSPVGSTDPK